MKVAVIGYGGQGAWHCQQIMKSDVAELMGIFDIKEERCQSAADRGIHVYHTVEDLFADRQVDVVVVATPNDVHEILVTDSLKNGKHVVCEKPVALSVDSFDRMVNAANEAGRILTVHQNRRWDVDFLALKQVIDSDEIGKTIRIESRIHGSRGIPSDWRGTKHAGGGMILDWGVHLIDQILQLIPDTVITVNCETTHITNQEVDDGFRLELNFEGGKTAYVEVGTYNFISMPRFYMQCDKGALYLQDWKQKAHVAKLKTWVEKDITPVQNAAGITKTMAPRDELTLDWYDVEIPVSDVHQFYRNLSAVIEGVEELIVKPREVRRVLSIMENAFSSAKIGQRINTYI